MSASYDCVLIKYGELALRGANRPLFESALARALNGGLAAFGGLYAAGELGRLVVRAPCRAADFAGAARRAAKVCGVVSACPAVSAKDASIENIKEKSLEIMRGLPPAPFRVTATRANKNNPLRSNGIAGAVGAHILENLEGFTVDLQNHRINLRVEVRNRVYLYTDEIKGWGGLPPGTCGRALALLSGGIDSPAAMFLAGKRGVKTDAVYFHAPPYVSERAFLKVKDVCKVLSAYLGEITLYAVNFTEIQNAVKAASPPEKFMILLKRAMLKTARAVAAEGGCDALIMGDSLGQVASQTVRSIAAIDAAVNIPVLRPLAGFDKTEITALARQIGTYEISIRPYDDCCTLFVPPHPETRPKISIIEAFEKRAENLGALCEGAAREAEVFKF